MIMFTSIEDRRAVAAMYTSSYFVAKEQIEPNLGESVTFLHFPSFTFFFFLTWISLPPLVDSKPFLLTQTVSKDYSLMSSQQTLISSVIAFSSSSSPSWLVTIVKIYVPKMF
jgi:hypothetical protein